MVGKPGDKRYVAGRSVRQLAIQLHLELEADGDQNWNNVAPQDPAISASCTLSSWHLGPCLSIPLGHTSWHCPSLFNSDSVCPPLSLWITVSPSFPADPAEPSGPFRPEELNWLSNWGDQRRLDSKVKVREVKERRTELQVYFLFESPHYRGSLPDTSIEIPGLCIYFSLTSQTFTYRDMVLSSTNKICSAKEKIED